MRIAIFTDFYFEDVPIATTIKQLKKRYEEMGHLVYILTAVSPNLKVESEEGVFTFTSAHIKQHPKIRMSLSPFLSTKKIVRGLKIDVIHNFAAASMGFAAGTCSKELKIPSVATITEALPHKTAQEGSGRIDRIMRSMVEKYCQKLYSYFDSLTYPSQYIRGNMKDIIGDGEIISLPVENGEIKNINKFVGHVGASERSKNLSLLKDKHESIRNRVKKDLKIYLTNCDSENCIPYEERWKYYSLLQAYIEVPNYNGFNSFGIEYLLSRKAIISPKQSPLSEVLEKIDKRLVYEEKYLTESLAHALEEKTLPEERVAGVLKEIESSPTRYLKLYESIFY